MPLNDLIRDLDCTVKQGDPARVRITDVVEDSRTCVPGCLFIARPGTAQHGALFIADALAHGAEAVLAERGADLGSIPRSLPVILAADVAAIGAHIAHRFYNDPTASLYTAGVTGTNGKTTITALAQALLNHADQRCGLIGTVTIDDGHEVGTATLTTPPATEIARTMASVRDHGCAAAMLECSSHALDQQRCAGVRFDSAVFSNLSGDHLDYHNTLETYARAKATLFELVGEGLAIVHAQDPATSTMLDHYTGQRVLRYAMHGCAAPHDAHVRILDRNIEHQRLELAGPWGTLEAALHTTGAHNALNALAACCISHDAGLDAAALAEALPHARLPAGRMQRVTATVPGGPRVFVDFAHTDDALATTLRCTREAMGTAGRLIAVFGCGGDRDRTKRPRMGRAACAHADVVVLTSDNPRSEPPSAIIDDVLAGLDDTDRARVKVHADRSHAIRAAIALADDNDVVVIAGKGHEREQITLGNDGVLERCPFDDAEHAASALELRSVGQA